MLCFSVKLIAWSSPLCFIVLSTLFLFLNKRLFSGETKIKWSQSEKKTKKRKKIVCAWRKLTFKNLNSDFMIFGHDVAFISTTIVINSVLQSYFFIATAKLVSNYICVKYLINSYIYLRWCNFNQRVWPEIPLSDQHYQAGLDRAPSKFEDFWKFLLNSAKGCQHFILIFSISVSLWFYFFAFFWFTLCFFFPHQKTIFHCVWIVFIALKVI